MLDDSTEEYTWQAVFEQVEGSMADVFCPEDHGYKLVELTCGM